MESLRVAEMTGARRAALPSTTPGYFSTLVGLVDRIYGITRFMIVYSTNNLEHSELKYVCWGEPERAPH